MSWTGILFLVLCWLLFFGLVLVQFLALGLIPVLTPVLVSLILIQTGLLQRAHAFAEGLRTPAKHRSRSAIIHGVTLDSSQSELS